MVQIKFEKECQRDTFTHTGTAMFLLDVKRNQIKNVTKRAGKKKMRGKSLNENNSTKCENLLFEKRKRKSWKNT